MRKLYPESLADKSFDNTGLLLEAPCTPSLNDSVLLTIDLTNGVADEAIQAKHSVVVSYRKLVNVLWFFFSMPWIWIPHKYNTHS